MSVLYSVSDVSRCSTVFQLFKTCASLSTKYKKHEDGVISAISDRTRTYLERRKAEWRGVAMIDKCPDGRTDGWTDFRCALPLTHSSVDSAGAVPPGAPSPKDFWRAAVIFCPSERRNLEIRFGAFVCLFVCLFCQARYSPPHHKP